MSALTPLITAEEGFPALERLAAEAQDEFLMSFRIFDPDTKLRDKELRAQGLETWTDLLARVAERGVRLRVLLADFDPFFTRNLHHVAWRSAEMLREHVKGNVQVMCAPHGQAAGWFWRLVMRRRLRKTLADLKKQDPADLTPVEKAALRGVTRLRPVTIHQKFAIADRRACVIGGLDINERRFDTLDHDQVPQQTWHDVSMRVESGFCHALAAHFAETWNAALDCGAAPEGLRIDREPQSDTTDAADQRLLRTFSAPCSGAGRLSPRPLVRENEEATLDAIAQAEHSIYIETQFLRHRPVIEALAKAAERPGLNLVMILPPFAERVLFDGDYGWDARHAHALQARGLSFLTQAFGERFAAIAPAQPVKAEDDVPGIEGAGPVYVHSKVTLIDERIGIVGSANLNGRSLRWDTEASVMFDDAEVIRGLRDRLAGIWLAEAAKGADVTRAETWTFAARANAARAPEDRIGFALPYPLEKVRRFSRLLPILPDDMF